MKYLHNEFEVNSNIEKVWEFYTDLKHLEIMSPSDIKLHLIESTDKY
jgi:carbon monoxide dehydrogenase subunit G